ncbi:FHA domain-containing protein [Pseudomarimonas salicorniae]|uniref:FHA domain-containing protein n=1 Tax=Pseudomarimonas salicorniae TaxID=2933270 RepID=A0ABT0GDF0_9GAMM|nr:FHA domain-containing protein [Lysobacter sp. CAU 1642]MCK7592561.1 FHA domain-containing protein [Lysobacter sp. CAU 1642]
MKLIFPNGEHGQVLLSEGVNRIGSAPDAQVRLDRDEVAPVHCELQLSGTMVTVRVPDPSRPVTLNGKPVQGVMAVRAGDEIGVAGVVGKLVSVERAAGPAGAKFDPENDAGATRMRMAVPKFVLRGVSGPAFGKTYPVPALQVIGRSEECNICIPAEEISRRHAQVKPTGDGLAVEDLGSANGTFINGQKVQNGVLKPGDELRLDTIRFLLVAPGMEIAAATKAPPPAPAKKSGGSGVVVGVVIAVVAAAAAAGWYFFLR